MSFPLSFFLRDYDSGVKLQVGVTMAITMRDVAKQAGVSLKTVSRVVNGEANVTPQTREKVMQVVKELNFVPNKAAATLSRGKSQTIGLVLGWPVVSTYSAAVINAVMKECKAVDYGLSLYTLDKDILSYIERVCTGKQVDGFIVDTLTALNENILSLFDAYKIPYVVIHPGWIDNKPHISTVTIDDYAGAKQAVEYLIKLGHEEIGFIQGESALRQDKYRLAGYRDILIETGIAVRESLICKYFTRPHESLFHCGFNSVRYLLENNPDITALFCQTDDMAVGAMSALWQAGKRVPDDISIIGFDDIRYAEMSVPPLTTIRQPIQLIAEVAIRQVISLIREPQTIPINSILPTELIIRSSTKSRSAGLF